MDQLNRDQITKEQRQEALANLRAIYDDKCAEINGRKYVFAQMTHLKRRDVFAFYSSIGENIKDQNYAFLTRPDFAKVESIIAENVTFDGMQLSKLPDHWDKYPQDYVTFITMALAVVSFPFLPGAVTG